MPHPRVLIVEDEALVAMDVEDALTQAGYGVCGVASSEAQALSMADRTHRQFAIVDIDLNPGDARVIARLLRRRHGAAVLFATGQCDDIRRLDNSAAIACLPKPYRAEMAPRALCVIDRISHGDGPERLPDHMFSLGATWARHPTLLRARRDRSARRARCGIAAPLPPMKAPRVQRPRLQQPGAFECRGPVVGPASRRRLLKERTWGPDA